MTKFIIIALDYKYPEGAVSHICIQKQNSSLAPSTSFFCFSPFPRAADGPTKPSTFQETTMNTTHFVSCSKFMLLLAFSILLLPAGLFAQNGAKDFHYWFDKGALLSVYGNQNAAIQAFQNAIELEPENSGAHFNMSIAYAENGDFHEAMEAVNMAKRLNPGSALYQYGKAWIYIRFGDTIQGTVEMQKAAEMNSLDAKQFLQSIAPRQTAN